MITVFTGNAMHIIHKCKYFLKIRFPIIKICYVKLFNDIHKLRRLH